MVAAAEAPVSKRMTDLGEVKQFQPITTIDLSADAFYGFEDFARTLLPRALAANDSKEAQQIRDLHQLMNSFRAELENGTPIKFTPEKGADGKVNTIALEASGMTGPHLSTEDSNQLLGMMFADENYSHQIKDTLESGQSVTMRFRVSVSPQPHWGK